MHANIHWIRHLSSYEINESSMKLWTFTWDSKFSLDCSRIVAFQCISSSTVKCLILYIFNCKYLIFICKTTIYIFHQGRENKWSKPKAPPFIQHGQLLSDYEYNSYILKQLSILCMIFSTSSYQRVWELNATWNTISLSEFIPFL